MSDWTYIKGTELVAEVGDWDYSWSVVAVFRDLTSGKLYWGSDSGCSCYSPFEDVTSVEGLSGLTKATYTELERAVREELSEAGLSERNLFLQTVRETMGMRRRASSSRT